MFGLDDKITGFSDGTTLLVVAAVAVLLGLRHASDPDHLAAVTTLIASGRERATRAAARLGFVWGLGHATSLFLFGLPVVLYSAYLPEAVQSGAETSVGFLIVALATLAVFAFCTAVSMALLSTGFGVALGSAPVRRSFDRLAPALGVSSLAFGVWYALGAQGLVPYVF